jgi:hypothetical protein
MKLKSLELTLDINSLPRDSHTHIMEMTSNLIHHVSDLESLYLMLPEPIDLTTLKDRLSNHYHLTI